MVGTSAGRVMLEVTGARVFRNGTAVNHVQPFDQVGVILNQHGNAALISVLYRSDRGVLTQLVGDSVGFRLGDGSLSRVQLTSNAVFLRNGRRVARGELRTGDQIYVVYDVASGFVRAIHAVEVFGEGLIMANFVGRGVLMIAIDQVTAMYGFTDGAVIVGREGRMEKGELEPGMAVRLVASGGFISYLEVREGGGGP
jgi:hypothetical protein